MKRVVRASSQLVYNLPEAVMDVVDIYNSSTPVSGDWATETEHEMNTIAEAFNVTPETAKAIMINELGFEPADFN